MGQHILRQFGGARGEERALEVVGVAKTAKYRSIGEAPRNFVYVLTAVAMSASVKPSMSS